MGKEFIYFIFDFNYRIFLYLRKVHNVQNNNGYVIYLKSRGKKKIGFT
jgi:hypothetical protein